MARNVKCYGGPMHGKPWQVTRKVSILDDFDEWWRQAVLEATWWLVGASGRIIPNGG